MFKFKQKIVNNLIIKGKKNLSENLFKNYLKIHNKKNLKKSKKLIQLIINLSTFIFKHSKTKNFNLYFKIPNNRILFALKQSVKYQFFNQKLTVFKTNQKIVEKKKQLELVLNKKILFFYRWKKL
jgi:hypothetical protein